MNKQAQQGYFLILAVIFIIVIGAMGTIISYLFSNRAMISVAQQKGLNAFYLAESGLEIGTRFLTTPALTGTSQRIACASLTGNSAITNASLNSGTFTVNAINNTPYVGITTLSAAVTTTSATISVASTSGFAPSGRILIDRENIDYAAISGNSFIGVIRGANNTIASAHVSGAGVGQYQCSIEVQSGIPNLTSPSYQRELQWNVELQEGWVAGNSSGTNFVFSHWNRPTELSWSVLNEAGGPSVANLNDISMLSNVDGWAVGNLAGSNFTFLHWNGSTWQLTTVGGACSGQNLLSVSMVSSKEGWAVGPVYKPTKCTGGKERYTIMYWNGSSWTGLSSSTSPAIPADNNNNQNLNAIQVIDTAGTGKGNFGFAVGNGGRILQYNGSTWTQVTSPTSQNLNGVYVTSASDAWAAGTGGVILHWNGSAWSASTPTTTQLNDIAMYDTNNDGIANVGWAVGNSGEIVAYNNGTWTASTSGANNLYSIAIINSQDAWAAGAAGAVLHWNGSTWTSVSTGTSVTLNGISLISPKQKPTSAWQQTYQ